MFYRSIDNDILNEKNRYSFLNIKTQIRYFNNIRITQTLSIVIFCVGFE